jgi:hypothetical protein
MLDANGGKLVNSTEVSGIGTELNTCSEYAPKFYCMQYIVTDSTTACKHVQTCNNRGISSLLSNDSVNILGAANAGNSSQYIVITCYRATEQ